MGTIVPEPRDELLSRDHFSRTLKQGRQDLKRLLLEPDVCAGFSKLGAYEIDFE